MITVRVRYESRSIRQMEISGHALFADYGKDIVCAAVSAIVFGSMNAIDLLMPECCQFDVTNDRIELRVIHSQDRLELLLEMMLIELETVAQSYPDYLDIRKETPCDSH